MKPILLTLLVLLCLPLVHATAQSAASSVQISPIAGDLSTVHQARAQGFPPNVPVTVVFFDPTGAQSVMKGETGADGSVAETLQPPGGKWSLGMYRWMVALANGAGASATFAAEDGTPHLLALPDSPSPFSALQFIGLGLAPNASTTLILMLTAAEGQRDLNVTTDANGNFALFVWPGQFGLAFWAAGDNKAILADSGIGAAFRIREHPVTANIVVDGNAVTGGLLGASFRNYHTQRYIWAVYAGADGTTMGEFLLGPTDLGGELNAGLPLALVPPGQYYLGTPYDWGEAPFTVETAPPTATPTPSPTVTPSLTPTPRPKAKPCKKGHYRRHGKCHKKKHISVVARWVQDGSSAF